MLIDRHKHGNVPVSAAYFLPFLFHVYARLSLSSCVSMSRHILAPGTADSAAAAAADSLHTAFQTFALFISASHYYRHSSLWSVTSHIEPARSEAPSTLDMLTLPAGLSQPVDCQQQQPKCTRTHSSKWKCADEEKVWEKEHTKVLLKTLKAHSRLPSLPLNSSSAAGPSHSSNQQQQQWWKIERKRKVVELKENSLI